MASSGMLRCVALVRNEVSGERRASIIRVTKIGELETTLAVTSNRRTQRRKTTLEAHGVTSQNTAFITGSMSVLPHDVGVNILVRTITVKNVVFWNMTPCGCSKNRRFGVTYRSHLQRNETKCLFRSQRGHALSLQ
jgi:hypothetical protein